jgi:hypothetical protein
MLLPLAHGVVLGEEEHYGTLDDEGYFQEVGDPRSLPPREIGLLGSNIALLLPCTAEILDPLGEGVATLHVGVVKGRVACTSITAYPERELTGQLLRVAIANLVKEVARNHVVHLRDGFVVRFVGDSEPLEGARRRVVDDAFLERVAEIYRQAVIAGLPTQQEIQRHLGPVAEASARRWVLQARRAGFLGPAYKGKAGETHGVS